MSIKYTLAKLIYDSLKSTYPLSLKDIHIDKSKEQKYGDYSTNLALILSCKLKKTPIETAQIIIANLNLNKILEKCEYNNLGFINFYLKKEILLDNVNEILEKNNNYGKSTMGNLKKINITTIDTNKNISSSNISKNLNGIIYNDNLARIFNYLGYDVIKEFYIKNQDKNNLSNISSELDKYRINFDIYTTEQSLYTDYVVDNVLSKIKYSDACYIDDNNLMLKTTSYEDNKDRILIKSDGTYTDLSIALAYNIGKINQNYQKIINIIAEEDYLDGLNKSLESLNKNNKIIYTKKIKALDTNINLSKNTNDINFINTIRYALASVNNKKQNLDEIIKNQEYDYSYIESTYIKIIKLLKINNKISKSITIDDNLTYTILNKLSEFVDTVITCKETLSPDLLCDYIYKLSKLTNLYLEKNTPNSEKIYLLQAIKIILNNALNLIGIIPKEEI